MTMTHEIMTVYGTGQAAIAATAVITATEASPQNWGGGIETVESALVVFSMGYPETTIALRACRKPLKREAMLPQVADRENIIATESMAYGEFTRRKNLAAVVLTDSPRWRTPSTPTVTGTPPSAAWQRSTGNCAPQRGACPSSKAENSL